MILTWSLDTKYRDVNETLGSEIEERPRRLIFSPRQDRDRDIPTLCRDRDRDDTETFIKFRVRDETDTETFFEVLELT